MSIRRNRKSSLRRRVAAIATAGALATTGGLMAASPASAATVSDRTIANAAKNAGLSGCRGVSTATWVAIALAESNGNTHARATGIEDSRGLWQVNLWAHGDWVGKRNLYDISTNAWAAKKVCQMQGPKAWSTYTNGAYKKFLSRGHAVGG
ncbi:transglycosylase [Frankia sp. CNm7]|uniref:Transglycosylase n=1 Tax=Frankia nepalensis TaxID=1836974 RepID=A0A937UMI4_9ACTN|nr:transglycosylase [Frankia nepalensis]MBL7501290.1 transglycosylase [Frankia nepalensis]MBL7510137.1 transglycosylase [Frankia nepalensis]MBL7520292.1 transglycosylase [Frankia nepalensis]MBL7627088.1 transglycosylase [Frankia nepalensis]